MTVDDLTKLISSLGFPIVVAAWLLYRDYRVLQNLNQKLDTLIAQIGALLAKEKSDAS